MKLFLTLFVVLAFLGGGYYWYSQRDVVEETMVPQGKLNIDVVCASALAYMTFPDGASADAFVAECKEGKHPEVIERYKADMGYGEGVAI